MWQAILNRKLCEHSKVGSIYYNFLNILQFLNILIAYFFYTLEKQKPTVYILNIFYNMNIRVYAICPHFLELLF